MHTHDLSLIGCSLNPQRTILEKSWSSYCINRITYHLNAQNLDWARWRIMVLRYSNKAWLCSRTYQYQTQSLILKIECKSLNQNNWKTILTQDGLDSGLQPKSKLNQIILKLNLFNGSKPDKGLNWYQIELNSTKWN